jgi:hypothetical protein
MNAVALLAGIVLPESIMQTQWFAVLSTFVAINTGLTGPTGIGRAPTSGRRGLPTAAGGRTRT